MTGDVLITMISRCDWVKAEECVKQKGDAHKKNGSSDGIDTLLIRLDFNEDDRQNTRF